MISSSIQYLPNSPASYLFMVSPIALNFKRKCSEVYCHTPRTIFSSYTYPHQIYHVLNFNYFSTYRQPRAIVHILVFEIDIIHVQSLSAQLSTSHSILIFVLNSKSYTLLISPLSLSPTHLFRLLIAHNLTHYLLYPDPHLHLYRL